MRVYAIRKNNMYLYLRYIDGDWDIPQPGDYYGAIRIEHMPLRDDILATQYWTSNRTFYSLGDDYDVMKRTAEKWGGELVEYELHEVTQ